MWKAFEAMLKLVVDFIRDKPLRIRFQALCLTDKVVRATWLRRFTYFSSKPIDWRWEKMMDTLSSLAPLIIALLDNFNYDLMVHGVHDESNLNKECLKAVRNLQTDANRETYILCIFGFRGVLESVGHCANWCEGCECHSNQALPDLTSQQIKKKTKN